MHRLTRACCERPATPPVCWKEKKFVEFVENFLKKKLLKLSDKEFKKKVLNIERQADIKVSSDWHPTNWNEVELWEQEVDFVRGGSLGGGLVLTRNDWHKLSVQANADHKLGFHHTWLLWLWLIHFLLTSFFSLTRLVVSVPLLSLNVKNAQQRENC